MLVAAPNHNYLKEKIEVIHLFCVKVLWMCTWKYWPSTITVNSRLYQLCHLSGIQLSSTVAIKKTDQVSKLYQLAILILLSCEYSDTKSESNCEIVEPTSKVMHYVCYKKIFFQLKCCSVRKLMLVQITQQKITPDLICHNHRSLRWVFLQ